MKSAFSEILGSLRRERGLSQRRAAADLGISQALLSHYENDAREPKLDFVVKACGYYDVPADYILGRSSERSDETALLMKEINDVLTALEGLNLASADIIANLRMMASASARNQRKSKADIIPISPKKGAGR